ncbi:hypothetical protein JCM10450v2_006391 [Rhodotorula kratochvilovae]
MDRHAYQGLLGDGVPPYASLGSFPHPAAAPPPPASSSALAPLAAQPKPKIPAFAPAAASPSSPAAHALAPAPLPATAPPPPSFAHSAPPPLASTSYAPPQSFSASAGTAMRAPIPTTNRRIPAFGPSSSAGHPPSGPLPSVNSLLSPAPPSAFDQSYILAPAHTAHAAAEDDVAAEALSALARGPSLSPPTPPFGPAPTFPSARRVSIEAGLGRRESLASVGEEPAQSLSPPESSASPNGTTMGDGADDDGRGKGKKELKQTKRAAQNRAAQRAFRERKQQQIRDLESRAAEIPLLQSQVQTLSARVAQCEAEKHAWERERAAMCGELDALRRMVGVAPAPALAGAMGQEGEEERAAKRRREEYAAEES